MALLFDSSARNAAIDSTAATDQRGLPVFGPADLGAFEVQTISAPRLSIHLAGANVVVSWEKDSRFYLERTERLLPDAQWVEAAFTTEGNLSSASLSAGAAGSAFFRLRQR
jgi:hypothetical protein